MIIDLLTQKNNIVKFSFFDSLSTSMLRNGYFIKTLSDIKSWKVKRDILDVYISIISSDISKLKEINLKFSGVCEYYTIEWSIDYVNWNEFKFRSKNDVIYKSIEDDKFLNLDTSEIVDFDNDMIYTFKKYNQITKDYEYLNEDIFYFIRIKIHNIQASELEPFYIENMEILIDEEINLDLLNKSFLSTFSSIFYSSRMFNEYDFFPDIIKNFMKMMEVNNTNECCKEYVNTFLEKSIFNIELLNL